MRQFLDLGLVKIGARSAALSVVSLAQIGSDLAPVTVAQNQLRSDQVSPTFGSPGIAPVTGDAFGRPDLPAAVSRRRIHYMFIRWSRSTAHAPGGRRGALPASASARRCLSAEKRNGVSILFQLPHINARRFAERLEAIKFTGLLAVLDDHTGVLHRQPHYLRDLVGRGRIHIDPPVLPDQIGQDGSKFLLGPLSPQGDHFGHRLFPLCAAPPRSGDLLQGMTFAADLLERRLCYRTFLGLSALSRRGWLLNGNDGGRQYENKDCDPHSALSSLSHRLINFNG